jgi:hypothetical protein
MEELASMAVQSNATSLVSQVYDQYLNYISLEPNLFSLDLMQAYHTLHNPSTPETKIEQVVDQITTALFSVVVTLGNVPIIKCPKGGVAEAVAKKLDSKLRDNIINSRASLFGDKLHLTRPVLVIVDRNLDLSTMLTHSWTYSNLIQDMFGIKLNRVNAVIEEKGRKTQKSYDIDVMDSFWTKNASRPLPEVGIFIEEETKKYKDIVNSVGVEAMQDPHAPIAQNLSSTIDQLPELRMKQKILDMHTVIATQLLNNIVNRQLDSFISMEESIGKLNTSTVLQIIRDSAKDPEDKMRLFLIYFLTVGDVPKEDLVQIEIALKEAGCDISSLQYMKHVKMYSKMSVQGQQAQQVPTGDLLGSFTSNFSKLTESLQTTGIGEGFGSLISGVKNMLPSRKELPLTQVVDAIMDGNLSNGVEEYLTLDPKLPRPGPPKKQTFQDAVVFVIGGGNYNEYHNLLDYAQVMLSDVALEFGEEIRDVWCY